MHDIFHIKNEHDDKIVSISNKLKVDCFRGSESNVTQRVIRAAKHYQTDLIVRATSDCPLIDLDLISQAYNTFLRNYDTQSATWKKFRFNQSEYGWI